MNETIQSIIPNTTSGAFGQKAYNLIITNKRLIVAVLTNEMIKQAAKQRAEESKARGEGFLKRMAKTAFAGTSLYQKYFDMPIEDILTEHEQNFYLDASMIKKISVKNNSFNDFQDKKIPNEIKIKSTMGKQIFRFTQPSAKEVKNALTQVFGPIVK